MKKRFLAVIMALAVFTSASPVFALDFEWEAEVSDDNVEVGDVFYLDLDVTANPGINNATFGISYNPDVVVPALTEEAAPDLLYYNSSMAGAEIPLFPSDNVDDRVNATDPQSGEIRFSNYISEPDENLVLKEAENSGTLLRVYFKAVGNGNADLGFTLADICRTPMESVGNMAYSITIPKVIVGAIKDDNISANENTTVTTTETTTTSAETTTETTTSNSSGSNTSSSSSSSGSNGTTTTATEATTEATTAVTETTTEATTTQAPAFTDLGNYPWAEDYINSLASQGIVNGYNDNTFKPGDNVKRADFIIMLLKAMGVDTTKSASDNFSDVRADKYYYNAVGIAKEMGIASGSNDGTFSPENNITRQDMMILAKKAVEMQTGTSLTGDVSVLDQFADKDSISAYAVDSLAAMVEGGIVSGTGNNIQPKDNTTRAQAAVIISKVLDLMK